MELAGLEPATSWVRSTPADGVERCGGRESPLCREVAVHEVVGNGVRRCEACLHLG